MLAAITVMLAAITCTLTTTYVPYHVTMCCVAQSCSRLLAYMVGLDVKILQDLLGADGISYDRLAGFCLSLHALVIEQKGSSLRCATHLTGTHNWSRTRSAVKDRE